MLDSVLFNLKSIQQYLQERGRSDLNIPSDSWSLLRDICDFMRNIKEISQYLEAENAGSFSFVYPILIQIKLYIKQKIEEGGQHTQALNVFQQAISRRFFEEYMSDKAWFTLMFNPNYKDLEILDNFSLLGYQCTQVDELKAAYKARLISEYQSYCQSHQTPTTRNFFDLSTNPVFQVNNRFGQSDEVTAYLEEPVTRTRMVNPLEWWGQHRHIFPNLSQIARRHLTILGTTAPIERLWSKAKDIFTEKRMSLSNETFEAILLLKGLERHQDH
jgi:hypothetical protein